MKPDLEAQAENWEAWKKVRAGSPLDLVASKIPFADGFYRGWKAALRAKDARIAALEAEVARYAKARPTREAVFSTIRGCNIGKTAAEDATERVMRLFDPPGDRP